MVYLRSAAAEGQMQAEMEVAGRPNVYSSLSAAAPPGHLPTWLEDAAELVERLLQDDGEALGAVDVAESTGLPIHQVRPALRLLVNLGLVERMGRREHTHPRHVAVAFPGGRVSPVGHWTTQFYYRWVGERSAAAEAGKPDIVGSLALKGVVDPGTSAAAPPVHQEEQIT